MLATGEGEHQAMLGGQSAKGRLDGRAPGLGRDFDRAELFAKRFRELELGNQLKAEPRGGKARYLLRGASDLGGYDDDGHVNFRISSTRRGERPKLTGIPKEKDY